MEDKMNSVMKNGLDGNDSAFFAYIITPQDQDIDNYKDFCFRTKTVSIITEEGQVMQKVYIDKSIIQQLTFPKTKGEYGSPVVCVNIPLHNRPVIIGVLALKDEHDEVENENQIKIYKKTDKGFVDIDGRADLGILNITVNHQEGGKINLTVVDENNGAEFNLNVGGKINLFSKDVLKLRSNSEISFEVANATDSDKVTTLTYKRTEGLSYKDEFDNEITIKDGEVTLKSKKINLGSDNYEKAALGETLKKFLDSFIDEVSKITTATMMGTQPIINAAQVLQLKTKTADILSKVNNLE